MEVQAVESEMIFENLKFTLLEKVMNGIKAFIATLVAALLPIQSAFAMVQIDGAALTTGIVSTIIYSSLGIVMAALAFKVIDLITPGKLSKDIAENNIALALLTGLMMLGVCIIIAAVLAS